MNEALWNFKHYEDASLGYVGFSMQTNSQLGGFDTKIAKEEILNRL